MLAAGVARGEEASDASVRMKWLMDILSLSRISRVCVVTWQCIHIT
jgi:hypothetical protein